jgi:exodeoxyribonuclease-3
MHPAITATRKIPLSPPRGGVTHRRMKLITWNVNGLRSIFGKGFQDFVRAENPDMLLLQETKVDPATLEWDWLKGYELIWNRAQKPGYSGTGLLTKHKPLSVTHGIGINDHDREGRVVTAEFAGCYVVCVYTPNAQAELARLPYRMTWDAAFLAYTKNLEKIKPVLFAGDLNVAHKEIDIARPDANRRNPGFSDEERAGFDRIVEAGFVDAFRHFDQRPQQYTWWSYRGGARGRNVGWRIDYWCASAALREQLQSCIIRPDVQGSDHCPVVLEMGGGPGF